MSGLVALALRRPAWTALLLLASLALPLSRFLELKIDNSVAVWLDQESPEYRTWKRFKQLYGNDEWVLIAVEMRGQMPSGGLGKLAAGLRHLLGVVQVLDEGNLGPVVVRAMGLEPLLRSRDGQTRGILLKLKSFDRGPGRKLVVDAIRSFLSRELGPVPFHLGGPPVLNAVLDETSAREGKLYLPLAGVVSAGVLCLLFQAFRPALAVILSSLFATVWAMGLTVMLGRSLNMVSTAFPVLVLVLTSAGGVHVAHVFLRGQAQGSQGDWTARLASILLPYSLAAGTTAAGFLSLLTSHMQPVRELGLFSAGGVVLGFFSNLTLLPALLSLLKGSSRWEASWAWRLQARCGPLFTWIAARKNMLAQSSLLLFLACGAALFFLQTDSNVLHFFNPDKKIVRDYAYLTRNLVGMSTIELGVEGDRKLVAPYLLRLRGALQELPGTRFVSYPAGPRRWRAALFLDAMESSRFNRLAKRVKALVKQARPGPLRVLTTGTILLLNRMQLQLVATQIKSLLLAGLVMVLVLGLLLRSVKRVLAACFVNLLPIGVVFALMSLMGVTLNMATIMIASISIGIAIDDTVFFLVHFRGEERCAASLEAAVGRTFRALLVPMVFTSIMIALGFFVLGFSDFQPIHFFGLLGGVAMLVALLGDAVILPALLLGTGPRVSRALPEALQREVSHGGA